MAYRKYDTCFFERYAMLQLRSLLGHKFDSLVNRDRPDLQSSDGKSLGIEVTRAMEGGRQAALKLRLRLARGNLYRRCRTGILVGCPSDEGDNRQ